MKIEKFTVYADETIKEALKKIEENNNGFVCVINAQKKLVGVLTDGDIRRALIQKGDLTQVLKTFMNQQYNFLYEDEQFDNVVEKFKDAKITFLPIISKERTLKNIITKKQLHESLLQGEILNLQKDFFQLNQAEGFEIYNRPWGFYKTVVLSEFVQAKIIQVFPQQELSLQYHHQREEHWVIVKGNGIMTIGESLKEVHQGSYIFIPKGCIHRVRNTSKTKPLIISEVQLGEYFGEDDIIRIEDKYGRK